MRRIRGQLLLFSLLLVADQVSKWWIEQQPPFWQLTVIPGFFDLVKAHNFGVAFSILADWNHQWRTGMLLGLTIGIASMVALWWCREQGRKGAVSWLLTCILAGAVGNIWDRLQLGYVVDFIQWHIAINGKQYYWPAFNIADACISVAVVALLILQLMRKA
ncbi:MAG: signal peptidase II [Zetaproteobacteria bacterium]|nr:MAG: signal peptidase II [Zetaproteobacteria bacterium]